MIAMLLHRLLVDVLVLLAAVGAGYNLFTVVAAAAWRRTRVPTAEWRPPLSVLKPVRGVDREAFENFASFCEQDYPEFELLFGVQDPADPVLAEIARLRAAFPQVDIRVVLAAPRIGPNLKVCNLAALAEAARHDVLVMADSDVRVEPWFLARLADTLAQPNVGLVSCPYRGAAARTLGGRLEALDILTHYIPSTLVARLLFPVNFALGAVIALRRETLAAIGGLAELVDYLAEDNQFGRRVRDLGCEVVLADFVVDNLQSDETLRESLERRLRWARTVRFCEPGGYAGSCVTYGGALALLAWLVGGGWAVLGAGWLVRWLTAWVVGCRLLGDRALARDLWLLPLSDLLGLGLWALGLVGSTVVWRGTRYAVARGGRMTEAPERP